MEKRCGNCEHFKYEGANGNGLCVERYMSEDAHCAQKCNKWKNVFDSRQIPQPLKKERHAVGDYRCPTCGVYFVENSLTPFCGNCGQALILPEGSK